jgi:hypothetical protein
VCRERNVLSAAANGHSQVFPNAQMTVRDGWAYFYRDRTEVWNCNAVYAAAQFMIQPAQENGKRSKRMMILDTFQHQGSTVQIRLYDDGERFVLRATDTSGKPLNGYMYSVSKVDQIDATMAATLDPLKELAKTARSDVESEIWQQYVAAVNSLNK